jgi:polyphosphate kinase
VSHTRKRVLVNVPSEELGRFFKLPSAKGRTDLIFLDDAIRLCAPRFFTGFKLTACYAIKLSRDAELYLDEEFAENVVDKVRRSLRKRRTGVPARFLHDGAMPIPMLRQMRELLGVKKQELIRGGRYHNISDLMNLPLNAPKGTQETALPPVRPHWCGERADLFAQVRRSDRLLHFPYHDFSIVTELLRRASRDPAVTSISITLYRVARASLICETLIDAARRGKKVTAVVEVQARFDEGNNLFWGEALEQAGAHVIYSHEDVKVHCKLCLIERKEGRRTARYAYLATGNFHERTAKVYSDLALLTANGSMTQEVAAIFRYLRDETRSPVCKRLLLAPMGLRPGIERLIDREIAQAMSGRPAAIMMKLNSLEDRPMISKLYDASRAGVTVQLIVRGICCLIPGVRGMSTNIEAISIVDRFLEHARAYVFHNAGDPLVFLASADMMQRNLDRRVETAFPILDKALRQQVLDVLELQWKDEAKARVIDVEQVNAYRHAKWKRPGALRSQMAIHAYLLKVARKRS